MRIRKTEPIRAWCTRCRKRVYQHRGKWILPGQVFKCNECIYKDGQKEQQINELLNFYCTA